jgi:predicted AAA+ superfamily ATPase
VLHSSIPEPPNDWSQLAFKSHSNQGIWDQLTNVSGFPEPFSRNDPLQYNRWSARRRDLLIREDVRDLTQIRNLPLLEHMARMLPERVGSPFSLNYLRQDLEIAHDTAKSWLQVLTHLYYCFAIKPFATKAGRSLSKEPKLYMWDWSSVGDPAARFENMVASHLKKAIDAWNDIGYGDFDLFYWRDQQKRELDFVLKKKRKPIALFECKWSDGDVSPHFEVAESLMGLSLPKIQLVAEPGIDRQVRSTRVISAAQFFGALV